jgi:hypothetical protein
MDSVGNVLAGNFLFYRASPSIRPSVFRRLLVFLFLIESAMEWGITDNQHSGGWIQSMRLSVTLLPMNFMPYTDRINSSVKLFNGVVCMVLKIDLSVMPPGA